MFQIRVHGRGGQGVVTAAEMLSVAAFLEDKHAQAFPSFGSERMGAPVVAFCRISNHEIRLREPIDKPNAIIIQDSTLLAMPEVLDGICENGYILINSSLHVDSGPLTQFDALSQILDKVFLKSLQEKNVKIKTLDASKIANQILGRPIPNTVLLAGFVAFTKVLKLTSVESAINQKFSGVVAEKNVLAAREAYNLVV